LTTFTTEDLESLLTAWFPATIEPVHEGEYEVMSKSWPWPHRADWSKEYGWGKAVHVEQWRGLKEEIK
jgi:hypothetical protein